MSASIYPRTVILPASAVSVTMEDNSPTATPTEAHCQLRKERQPKVAKLRVLEEEHYGRWQSEKTLSAAAAFLKFYWGGAIDPVRIEEVFSATTTRGGGDVGHLFFTMTRALWAVARGDDLSTAVRIIEECSAGYPD